MQWVISIMEVERGNILVKLNRTSQYTTNTGQKTGILKISDQVQRKPMAIARVAECQNLNSGRRRMKGRNSSSCLDGRLESASPSSSPSSCVREGSNLGCKKARKRFRR
jgi:hypothetical protein